MAITRLAPEKFLDSLRGVGDPEVDDMVTRWFEESAFVDAESAIKQLHRHSRLLPEQMDPRLRSYFEDHPPVPGWVDKATIRRGQELFEQWGLLIGTALFCASLPTTYAAANGAKVLMRTGKLMTDPRRRLFETGTLIFNTMSVGGLEVGAPGWNTVRRVRLIHSAIRHLVLSDPGGSEPDGEVVGPWDLSWGVPICQEDLLGVMLALSVEAMEALRKGGAEVREVDKRSYLHAWNLIAYLIGIREDLLPIELGDAEVLFERICRRQFAPSEDGRVLTRVLLDFIGDVLPPPLRHTLPQASLRHFLRTGTADMLNIPESNWTDHLIEFCKHTAQAVSHEEAEHRLVQRFSEHAGRSMWRFVLAAGEAGDHSRFSIPVHLSDRWGL